MGNNKYTIGAKRDRDGNIINYVYDPETQESHPIVGYDGNTPLYIGSDGQRARAPGTFRHIGATRMANPNRNIGAIPAPGRRVDSPDHPRWVDDPTKPMADRMTAFNNRDRTAERGDMTSGIFRGTGAGLQQINRDGSAPGAIPTSGWVDDPTKPMADRMAAFNNRDRSAERADLTTGNFGNEGAATQPRDNPAQMPPTADATGTSTTAPGTSAKEQATGVNKMSPSSTSTNNSQGGQNPVQPQVQINPPGGGANANNTNAQNGAEDPKVSHAQPLLPKARKKAGGGNEAQIAPGRWGGWKSVNLRNSDGGNSSSGYILA